MVLICPRLVYVAVVITSLSTVSKKHQSLYRQGNCRNCDMLSPKSPVTHKQIENYNCYHDVLVQIDLSVTRNPISGETSLH